MKAVVSMADRSYEPGDLDKARAEALSELLDGELRRDEVARLCTEWRDAEVRATWHSFTLIGDVLRSEELASEPGRDARFMRDLRTRLAGEPVVLAPAASPPQRLSMLPAAQNNSAPARRSAWRRMKAPLAVSAGFAVVMGAMLSLRPSEPTGGSIAALPPALVVSQASAPMLSDKPLRFDVASESLAGPVGPIVRDPRLDSYLRAHQEFSGSSALGASSSFLRNAAAEMPPR
jgi:sigma-E factor negative regulatory protein RseA